MNLYAVDYRTSAENKKNGIQPNSGSIWHLNLFLELDE